MFIAQIHVRIVQGMPGCVRIRLPAHRDNAEVLDRIERTLGDGGSLSRIRGNAVTGGFVLEFTGVHEEMLVRLAAQLPAGLELSCSLLKQKTPAFHKGKAGA